MAECSHGGWCGARSISRQPLTRPELSSTHYHLELRHSNARRRFGVSRSTIRGSASCSVVDAMNLGARRAYAKGDRQVRCAACSSRGSCATTQFLLPSRSDDREVDGRAPTRHLSWSTMHQHPITT
jgi:hypothetical protein